MAESLNEKRQTQLKTPFVHVPVVDWAAVRIGQKREFRTAPHGNLPAAHNMPFMPILAVAWTRTKAGIRREELMILEEAWMEVLHAISQASIEAEGFSTRAEFKRYWRVRYGGTGWRALSRVMVIRVRPLEPGDLEQQAEALQRHLYGLWLPGDE